MDPAIEQGDFARKQLCSPARLIAWSHRRRFATGLELARRFAGRKVLDYGCGDGTFLALWSDTHFAPSGGLGVEIDPRQVEDCRTRLGQRPGLRFISLTEADTPEYTGSVEAVVCMEVLEHVTDVDAMLERFDRWLVPGGELLVSVPVETGLPLLVKQSARRVAGWFGVGDYPGTSPYSMAQLMKALFADVNTRLDRPRHRHEDGFEFHDHKGFNWMALRRQLAGRFELLFTAASPFLWLTPHLGSQAWLLARKVR